MNRRHAAGIAVLLGLAVLLGTLALVGTTNRGAAGHAAQHARVAHAQAHLALRTSVDVRPAPILVHLHHHGSEHGERGMTDDPR